MRLRKSRTERGYCTNKMQTNSEAVKGGKGELQKGSKNAGRARRGDYAIGSKIGRFAQSPGKEGMRVWFTNLLREERGGYLKTIRKELQETRGSKVRVGRTAGKRFYSWGREKKLF